MTRHKRFIIIIFTAVILGGVALLFGAKQKSPPGETRGVFGRFFPGTEEQKVSPATEATRGTSAAPEPAPVLSQLSQTPVAGAAFASSSVRFVERATGRVVEVGAQGEQPRRISNTTIPGVSEALFGEGDRVILRIIDETQNVKNVSASFANEATEGVFIDPAIRSFAVSPDRSRLFSLRPAGTRFSAVTSTFEYKGQKEIFTSPFRDFALSWPERNTVTLVTKPSAFAEGFLYAINLNTGALEKIAGGIPGLNALLSPDAALVLASRRGRIKPIETALVNRKGGASTVFPFDTLAEKCLWSRVAPMIYCAVPFSTPQAAYPDDWYSGVVSFSDSFVKINAETLESEIVFAEGGFDAINLFTDPEEKFLFFVNKKDGVLWSIKLP